MRHRVTIIIAITAIVVTLSILVTFYTSYPRSEFLPEPKGSSLEFIATRLEVPWSIDVDSKGRIFFTERVGRVNMIDASGKVLNLFSKDVAKVGEAGMLGLALDPEFESNGYIYIYYTYSSNEGLFNRVSRVKIDNGLIREDILIDRIPAAEIHNGGRIKFGPDGRLYVATGDANNPMLAQDLSSLAGKILRLNKDGSIPDDNPFPNSYVYSYGHRNVQGLAWNPINKMLYATEHGPIANDELNIIKPGANYGWPYERCSEAKVYEQSLLCYAVSIAPSGATFATDGKYKGILFFATLRGERVEMVTLDVSDPTKVVKMENFLSGLGRVRDVLYHDGYLYIATSNRDGRGIPSIEDDRIVRVRLG
jgi:Glucose/sorbosone dehydrogenases